MIYLEPFNSNMDILEYRMFQEIPFSENGIYNHINGLSFDKFKEFLKYEEKFKTEEMSYVFYDDGFPIGRVTINLSLLWNCEKDKSNIGYVIRPSKREQGYGSLILKMALKECQNLNFQEVFLKCNNNNLKSKKTILKNGGIYKEDINNISIFKINISQKINKFYR